MVELIKPERLKKGDLIGLISPCNGTKEGGFTKAVEEIEKCGFRAKISEFAYSFTDGYAASLEERVSDFNNMVRDDEVKMILFPGGEIGNELLPFMNYEGLKKHPKIVCSYSDGTTMVEAIHAMTGLVTFYGGSSRLFQEAEPYNLRSVDMRLVNPVLNYETAPGWITLYEGRAEGVMCGGYLVNYDTLIGNPWYRLPDKPYILFIEDYESFSSPKVVSKWLSDLYQKGVFEKATGFIFGHYSSDPEKREALLRVLRRHAELWKIPAVYCDDFGHGRNMSIFPIGIGAKLDATAKTLEFTDTGVK